MHEQFIVVPPLAKVTELFMRATALTAFESGTAWTKWSPLAKEDVEEFRPYIRPCHHNILNRVSSGTAKTPLVFLRQLLRPHGFLIETRKNDWILYAVGENHEGVHTKGGKTIVWNTA
jgi:hypothetical protein